jgi:tetratricopeptide (TPR) repeat protein
MSAGFDPGWELIITTDGAHRSVEFDLRDAHGGQLAWRRTALAAIPLSRQRGLFDLHSYLHRFVPPGGEAQAVAEIGVCIAEDMLGREIFELLWRPTTPRTLRIRLPGSDDDSSYAALLPRVPWEIARPSADKDTLADRNLRVRVIHDGLPGAQALPLGADEDLRVLLVFAESRSSNPLAARQEREQLLQLMRTEIYPRRRVVADVLSHGVTRERLLDTLQGHDGYHIVHWSGHGHRNLLELCRPDGTQDHLSGQALVDLFVQAGVHLPRLCFLGACHSGDLLRVRDWNDFLDVAQGREPGARQWTTTEAAPAETRDLDLDTTPGFTGTAQALLQAGVPAVIAMRYAVGDDYARELAVGFYRGLLGHAQPKSAAAALTLARRALAADAGNGPRYAACDHATPLLYGAEDPGLQPHPGRSRGLDVHDPRLMRIGEFGAAQHAHFVGRTWELAGLGSGFIGAQAGDETRPIAVITGLGGMGKTALAAEALALWQTRFTWVLLFQCKPTALGFETFLRDVDLKLRGELGRYHDHVRARPADAIFRDADAGFSGTQRQDRLVQNLVRALGDEPILLVLDNFETQLRPLREGETAAECQDPAWDACLRTLADQLRGTPSRVLLTSRQPLAALPADRAHALVLGPLPAAEAALYLRTQPALAAMVFGPDPGQRNLAQRLLRASRFHPLLMDRLARLAGDAALRPQLLQALTALEQRTDFAQLPELFAAADRGDTEELAYLDGALQASLDQLLQAAGAEARRLLWIVALANEPVTLGLLRGVWQGERFETQQLRHLKQMLDRLPTLPAELQDKLRAMPEELRAQLEALPPPPARPDLAPLLQRLRNTCLVTAEVEGPEDETPEFTCHELVRERIGIWMQQHPEDRGEWEERRIRLGYAERLQSSFELLQHQNMRLALEAGRRALVYCVQAEDWERLGRFASALVTSAQDPQLLAAVLPYLRTAADAAPKGPLRWRCLGYLADALRQGGRADASLPIYAQAIALARDATRTEGMDVAQTWLDLAVFMTNCAAALLETGKPEEARQLLIESSEAEAKAGAPRIQILGSEAEALRIDILQGRADTARPRIEAILAQILVWWQRHRAGEVNPEAPDAEFLVRCVIGTLDIAVDADLARKDWPAAVARQDTMLEVKRALQRSDEDIATTRMNRANVLVEIPGREAEAMAELEACLEIFRNDQKRRAKTLGCLSDVFHRQGDVGQAITLIRRALATAERLPNVHDRATYHGNLSIYLGASESKALQAEAHLHRLAGLLYCLVAGFGQGVQTSLRNYAINFRRAHAAGTALPTPRIADLLADPAFEALARWLREREVEIDALQAAVDDLLDQVRATALGDTPEPPA